MLRSAEVLDLIQSLDTASSIAPHRTAPHRVAVEAVPEGQVLESGWEELGMDDQWAARVATDMADEDNPATPIDFYKVSCAPP